MSEKILEVKDLHFYYGEIHALKGINLDVEDSEIVTLIGANGAGKTTTLRSISGLLGHIAHGEVRFMGERIDNQKGYTIAAKGMAQCLEGRHVFSNLTVKENLLIGAYLRKDRESINEDIEHIYTLFPRLHEREWQLAGTLSGGEQQMLAVGRALMAKPKLIMMDEPSLGLAPIVVRGIFEIIREINRQGITVLLIEQNANMALKVADWAYVMQTGSILMQGPGAELAANEEVKAAYLGTAK